jgi:glyoxylase-like metal-dependent hydrolase (beta-lactamase superfamily II)
VDVLDSYSGRVDPGGAAIRRDLDALTITKVSVGPMDNNAYLLVCRATNEALLVDAANEPDRLADLVGADDGRPELNHLVTTHRHQDHWQERIFGVLPDETWFYPGHGDDSTLGAERPHLAEWRERGW